MTSSPPLFPPGFLWGAATSAYQIEGSPLADGAGPSNWHRFAHTPGRMAGGDHGDIACDHYRKWPEDVALMRQLGLNSYRFSVSWSRVMPEGRGRVNPAGLDFYSRLVDALRAAGIQPALTLFHWDLPAALEDRGGWLNPDIAEWFADYARVVYRALGDRVALWMTLNEPWVVVDAGYLHGVHAPGHRSLFEPPIAAHNLLRAHGAAVTAWRAESRPAPIGVVVNLEPKDPATESAGDREASRRADAWMNRYYLDPILLRRYPAEMPEIFGAAWPDFPPADFDRIGVPIDFVGINYYTRSLNRSAPAAWPVGAEPVRRPGVFYTTTGWEVHPASLTRTLRRVRELYGDHPIYITENGVALDDAPPGPSGRVEDPMRIDYFRNHLRALKDALDAGVDVRGYFAWSLLDNLEWAAGFDKRFGLIHVDRATLARTPKASAGFYRRVIETNGAALA